MIAVPDHVAVYDNAAIDCLYENHELTLQQLAGNSWTGESLTEVTAFFFRMKSKLGQKQ